MQIQSGFCSYVKQQLKKYSKIKRSVEIYYDNGIISGECEEGLCLKRGSSHQILFIFIIHDLRVKAPARYSMSPDFQ